MIYPKIWYEDPCSFISHPMAFYPDSRFNYAEKLNSILRLCIYASVVSFGLTGNGNVMIIPLFAAGITAVIYMSCTPETFVDVPPAHSDLFQNTDTCGTRPTPDNPFMNITMNEYTQNPERGEACRDKETMQNMSEEFDSHVWYNSDDIFKKNASSRQFYTTPITTLPNKQGDFAHWLYKSPKTHKESHIPDDQLFQWK